jgi:hypothetical protein
MPHSFCQHVHIVLKLKKLSDLKLSSLRPWLSPRRGGLILDFGEIKTRKVTVRGKLCDLHLIVDRADFALSDFGLQQRLQNRLGLLVSG